MFNKVKKRINGILHRKSINTVFCELKQYIDLVHGQSKGKSVLIIVLSLLCRNLDCDDEIKSSIEKYNLTNCLYGGLTRLLCGKSDNFTFKIKWGDERFRNKYEYLNRFFFYDSYRNYLVIIMAARILQKIDQGKFEKLAYNDESRILLLNMINPLFLTDPSDTLIISLLKSDNDLLKNIGLFMISTKVSRNVDELHQIESGMCSNDCEKEVRNKLCTSVDAFISHLDKCDNKTQASLLVNYLLVHKRYPTIFAQKLIGNLQSDFALQIRESEKIKSVFDLATITQIISENSAISEKNTRISKFDLFMAVTDILLEQFEERKVNDYNAQQLEYICTVLPVKCKRRLKVYLNKKKTELMCEEIDRLVRFKIYLEDNKLGSLIDKILTII